MAAGMQGTFAAWIARELPEQVTIWVSDPETTKDGRFGKPFTTYLIHYLHTPSGEMRTCRRRFSEFEALQGAWRLRFGSSGMLIPPLPRKKVLGNTDRDFVVERMRGLSLFCEAVGANPFLRNDRLWDTFLAEDARMPAVKDTLMLNDPTRNVAEYRWNELLGLARGGAPSGGAEESKGSGLRSEGESTAEALALEAGALAERLKVTATAARNYLSTLRESTQAMAELSEAFAAWSETETAEIDRINEAEHLPEGTAEQTVPNVTSKMGTYLSATHSTMSKAPDALLVLVLAVLEHEYQRVMELQELLGIRQGIVDSISKSETKLSRTEKVEVQREIRATIRELHTNLANFDAGLKTWTVPIYVHDRTRKVHDMIRIAGSIILGANAGGVAAGVYFFRSVNCNPGPLRETVNAALEKLGVEAIDELPAGVHSLFTELPHEVVYPVTAPDSVMTTLTAEPRPEPPAPPSQEAVAAAAAPAAEPAPGPVSEPAPEPEPAAPAVMEESDTVVQTLPSDEAVEPAAPAPVPAAPADDADNLFGSSSTERTPSQRTQNIMNDLVDEPDGKRDIWS